MNSYIIKSYSDGLILRHATPADSEALSIFQGTMHADEPDPFDPRIAAWVQDLMNGTHPTFQPADFTIIEEPSSHKILSSLCMIDQIWSYDGIPFKVGRPELVATLPEFRNRGFVRDQMDVVHQWSEERGHLLQFITGIPYYYRLFGYEMTLELESGRNAYEFQIPKLKAQDQERFSFRPAAEADIPFIMNMYAQGSSRSLVNCVRDENIWKYELTGKQMDNIERFWYFIIENDQHQPVGLFAHMNELWGPALPIKLLEVIPGHPWMDVCQSVMRFAWKQGKLLAERYQKAFEVLGFWLGSKHPAYAALPDRLPKEREPYTFFIRIPDLCSFLQTIKPVLETRLANSVASGYTGELALSFYHDGLRFIFDKGKISNILSTTEKNPKAQASFPFKSFYHLIFGTKSLEELISWYADCSVETYSDARPLLEAIFSKRSSSVIPLC